MKLVLAGDNEEQLRKREFALLQEEGQGKERIAINVSVTTDGEMNDALGSTNLFGQPRFLQITGLEKLRSPKKIDQLLTQLSELNDDVLVVMASKLTPAKKKSLQAANWKIEEFSQPASVFAFTEGLKVKPLAQIFPLYQQALAESGEWGLQALLARQLRLLLATKTGATVQAPPFAIKKLQSQAARFSEAELVQALDTLFTIESNIKSGLTPLTWSQQFDIFLTRLYDEGHK